MHSVGQPLSSAKLPGCRRPQGALASPAVPAGNRRHLLAGRNSAAVTSVALDVGAPRAWGGGGRRHAGGSCSRTLPSVPVMGAELSSLSSQSHTCKISVVAGVLRITDQGQSRD